jgi:hypothetical protein
MQRGPYNVCDPCHDEDGTAVGMQFAALACDAGNLVRLFRWRPLAAETSSVRPSVIKEI